MPDLGLEVLFKGKNLIRLLGGLGVALKISAVSVLISLPLGILLGVLMTFKNPILKAILRVYLEVIRIMPQMVLLFLVYFGTTRAFGWDLSGETASVIVFVLWATLSTSTTPIISTRLVVLIMRVMRLMDSGISRRTVCGMMMYQ